MQSTCVVPTQCEQFLFAKSRYNSNLKIPHHSLAHPQLTNPQFSLETKNTHEANADNGPGQSSHTIFAWYDWMQHPTTCDLMLFHIIKN